MKKQFAKHRVLSKIMMLLLMSGTLVMIASSKVMAITTVGHSYIPVTNGEPEFVVERINLGSGRVKFHINTRKFNGRNVAQIHLGYRFQRVNATSENVIPLLSYYTSGYNWALVVFNGNSVEKLADKIVSNENNRETFVVTSETPFSDHAAHDMFIVVKFDDGTFWNGHIDYSSCANQWTDGFDCVASSFSSGNIDNVHYTLDEAEIDTPVESGDEGGNEGENDNEGGDVGSDDGGDENENVGDNEGENEGGENVPDNSEGDDLGEDRRDVAGPVILTPDNGGGDAENTNSIVAENEDKYEIKNVSVGTARIVAENEAEVEVEDEATNENNDENADNIEENDALETLKVPVLGGSSIDKSKSNTIFIWWWVVILTGAAVGSGVIWFFLLPRKKARSKNRDTSSEKR